VSVPVTIGLDVGGTKVAGGLVDAAGAVVERVVRPSVVGGAADPASRVTLMVARELLARAVVAGCRVDGIGAGFPEYVDPDGRLTSHEVLAWTDQPADLLARLAPATVESDVRCGALAEALLGAGRGVREVLYLSVGTGLSYALVIDGRPRQGRRGEAIAFGELEVAAELTGGAPVTLEEGVSGGALGRQWAAMGGDPTAGAREAVSAAADGDRRAIALVARAGEALGAGIATMARLLDPDLIVLGGGLARAGGVWRAALEDRYARGTASRPGLPQIVDAALGADAGMVGAALAHRRARTTIT
jgi:glucokinase